MNDKTDIETIFDEPGDDEQEPTNACMGAGRQGGDGE